MVATETGREIILAGRTSIIREVASGILSAGAVIEAAFVPPPFSPKVVSQRRERLQAEGIKETDQGSPVLSRVKRGLPLSLAPPPP